MTMQVCSGEWLLICLVLVMAWEKRGEKKGSPAGGKNLSARRPVALAN